MFRPVALTILALAISPFASSAESPPVAAESELRELVSWFSTDRQALRRRYPVDASPERVERIGRFMDEWMSHVEDLVGRSLNGGALRRMPSRLEARWDDLGLMV